MNKKKCEYCRESYSKYEMKPIETGPGQINITYYYICKNTKKCIQTHDDKIKKDELKLDYGGYLYEAAKEIRRNYILKMKIESLIRDH